MCIRDRERLGQPVGVRRADVEQHPGTTARLGRRVDRIPVLDLHRQRASSQLREDHRSGVLVPLGDLGACLLYTSRCV